MSYSILFICLIYPTCSAYNILVSVVGIAASQNLVMYRLAELLAQRGHNVTVLNANVFSNVKTAPLKLANELSYEAIKDSEVKIFKFSSYLSIILMIFLPIKFSDRFATDWPWWCRTMPGTQPQVSNSMWCASFLVHWPTIVATLYIMTMKVYLLSWPTVNLMS